MSDINSLNFELSKYSKNRLHSDTISKLNIQIENKKRILSDLNLEFNIIEKSIERNIEDKLVLAKILEINQSRVDKTKKLNDRISKIENILLGETNKNTVESNFNKINITNDIDNINNTIEEEKSKLGKLNDQINKTKNDIKILEDQIKKTKENHKKDILNLEKEEEERLKEEQLKIIHSLSESKNDIIVNDKKYNLSAKKVFLKDKIISKYFNNNKEISAKEYYTIINQRNSQKYKYGVIHPVLGKIMEKAKENQKIPVSIWSFTETNFNYNKKDSYTESFEKFLRKIRHINLPGKDNHTSVNKLFLGTDEGLRQNKLLTQIDNDLQIFSSSFTKSEILRFSKLPTVSAIFYKDTSHVLDIRKMKQDTGADIIVDTEGWRGTNLRACVFEGSPGDFDYTGVNLVNNNIDSNGQRSGIQEVYNTNSFPSSIDGADHGTTVTAIITNRGSSVQQRGYAPDSLIYCANDFSLDSLRWAVNGKECRVVNQSFHRDTEWDSSVAVEDDIYRDYLVLRYPFPFITVASGNWNQFDEDEPGGSDGSLEYVNHKSYNGVSVGNVEHFVSGRPDGMVLSSVWKNPDSDHGDWEFPELCANGRSARFNGRDRGTGTSFASPAVAGTALLLQNADNLLLNWPEGIRAILFAGAINNVKDGNWKNDNVIGIDGYDGCGCINTKESMRIVERSFYSGKVNKNNTPKPRGWNASVLTNDDFKNENSYVSYFIGVPNIDPTGNGSKVCNIKIGLAWNSKIKFRFGSPIKSILDSDFDLYVYNENGSMVANSSSWDNSYEVVDFIGIRGKIYEIRIKRHIGRESVWYGIAWNAGDGGFFKNLVVPNLDIYKNYPIADIIGNTSITLEYGLANVSDISEIWRNTITDKNYIIDYENIFKLITKKYDLINLKIRPSKLEKYLRDSNKTIIIMKLNEKILKWEPIKYSQKNDIFTIPVQSTGYYAFAINEKINSNNLIFDNDLLSNQYIGNKMPGISKLKTIDYNNGAFIIRNNDNNILTINKFILPKLENKNWSVLFSDFIDIQFKAFNFTKNTIKLFYGKFNKYDHVVCMEEIDDISNISCCYIFNGKYYLPQESHKNLLRYQEKSLNNNSFVSGRINITNINNIINFDFESSKHDINILNKQKEKWINLKIHNYNYNFNWSSFSEDKNENVKIQVRNNKIDKITRLSDGSNITDFSDYCTITDLFDKVSVWFDSYLCNFELVFDNKYGFIQSNFVKIINSDKTNNSFKLTNFKSIDGFFVKENENNKLINTKEIFRVIPITKDLPPSIIEINYENCHIRFQLNNSTKVGYIYNENMYIPQDKRLLRYSESGIVTEDYIPCRITLFGKDSPNPYTLSIEKNFYFFDKDKLENNRLKFMEMKLEDYKFDFNWQCYCTKEYTKVVTIDVSNNIIQNNFSDIKYYTLYELFDYVKDTITNTDNPYKVYIKYNPEFGYIEEFYIDKNKHIADEEIGFYVKNLSK